MRRRKPALRIFSYNSSLLYFSFKIRYKGNKKSAGCKTKSRAILVKPSNKQKGRCDPGAKNSEKRDNSHKHLPNNCIWEQLLPPVL